MTNTNDPIDLKIVQLHKQEFKNLQASQLMLEMSGNTVSSTLVNTLRRLCLDYIPTYAFCDKTITIEKNTSVFDNDYMRVRLSQMTPPNIINNIMYLDDKYWKNVNYSNPDREKHPDDKKIIEIYVNAKNNTKNIMNVTTNDIKFFEDAETVSNKFNEKFPMLIIQLRPNEVFVSKLSAVLGLGKNNNIWSASATSYYEEIDEHKFKLTIESQGQMDEYEILYKGCAVIKEKLKLIKSYIDETYSTSDITNGKELKLILENEDHTLGNMINETLQLNKNVAYSGMAKPYFMVDKIVITFITIEKNPLKPLYESLNYINSIFNNIQNQVTKLGKNFIKCDIVNEISATSSTSSSTPSTTSTTSTSSTTPKSKTKAKK